MCHVSTSKSEVDVSVAALLFLFLQHLPGQRLSERQLGQIHCVDPAASLPAQEEVMQLEWEMT